MYYDYFGLNEAPFSISPNPDYLLKTERHQEALAHLYHGVQSDAGFVLLTGDIGTGKTTVCRCFLDKLPENTQVAFILNPFLGARELLMTICQELKINSLAENASLRQLTEAIYQHLLNNHRERIQTVLLIDEAQHLHYKVLEMIRLLTNLETKTQKLLKIILVGQPELNDTLDKPELTQLSQRITARYHISPLLVKETSAYIDYRLRMAGYMGEKKIFPPAIAKKIFQVTGGVPRLINVICDRCLLGAYSQDQSSITGKVLKKSIEEVKGKHRLKLQRLWLRWSVVGLLIIVSILGYYFYTVPDNKMIRDTVENHLPTNEILPVVNVQKMPPAETEKAQVPPVEKPENTDFIPFFSQNEAIITLIDEVVFPKISGDRHCQKLERVGWSCQKIETEDWSLFYRYNRPAVVTLFDKKGNRHYLPILGISNNEINIITASGYQKLSVDSVRQQWAGEFIFLWQPPENFSDHIYFDSPESLVVWLAKAFADIDQRDELLTQGQFNSLLRQRVILFQRDNDLQQDGIAGLATLLKINESLGKAITLLPTGKSESIKMNGAIAVDAIR